MIRIAVCDDDKNTITMMEELLLQLSEKGNIRVRIETYSDGAFLLNDIRRGVEFDLLYLDIEMEQLDGLSLAREVRKDHPNACLLYTSLDDGGERRGGGKAFRRNHRFPDFCRRSGG